MSVECPGWQHSNWSLAKIFGLFRQNVPTRWAQPEAYGTWLGLGLPPDVLAQKSRQCRWKAGIQVGTRGTMSYKNVTMRGQREG
jgi:hypothetical protein